MLVNLGVAPRCSQLWFGVLDTLSSLAPFQAPASIFVFRGVHPVPSPIHPSRVHTMQGFHGAVDDHLVYLVDLVFGQEISSQKDGNTEKHP